MPGNRNRDRTIGVTFSDGAIHIKPCRRSGITATLKQKAEMDLYQERPFGGGYDGLRFLLMQIHYCEPHVLRNRRCSSLPSSIMDVFDRLFSPLIARLEYPKTAHGTKGLSWYSPRRARARTVDRLNCHPSTLPQNDFGALLPASVQHSSRGARTRPEKA
jgi:hypothetical protein